MPGYSASVRPLTTYTNGIKNKLLRDAGISATEAPRYELDHLVPLAFGGRPRNLKNLALQPWDEAKQKGRLETRMHRLVCSQHLGLPEAQEAIWADWRSAYRR